MLQQVSQSWPMVHKTLHRSLHPGSSLGQKQEYYGCVRPPWNSKAAEAAFLTMRGASWTSLKGQEGFEHCQSSQAPGSTLRLTLELGIEASLGSRQACADEAPCRKGGDLQAGNESHEEAPRTHESHEEDFYASESHEKGPCVHESNEEASGTHETTESTDRR